MKYRKLSVVVEAFKWTGDIQKAPIWIVGAIERRDIRCNDEMTNFDTIKIKTLEGDHIARLGDYIIKGIHGEIYPCKPEIFEKTYELAE